VRFHVGSDHGGVNLRRALVAHAAAGGHEIATELGPAAATESVDYPDIAAEICRRVLADPGSFGLIVCGTGQGVAMAANRWTGIRAAVVADPFSAQMARAHNDANVLCLGERVLGQGLAKALFDAFVGAGFEGGRHERRVALIDGPRNGDSEG
jgi:ribose 5-phosphate isomerase B